MADEPAFKPSAFYRDPLAALRWLERAFSFETTTLVTEPSGRIGYSEMTFRGATVSINSEFTGDIIGGVRMVSPLELDGRCTQFIRVRLDDGIDAHCEQARAAGARITQEPRDEFYGERTYRALDPEGHVWNFAQPLAQISIEDQEAATGLTIRTSLPEADHG
ncbi:VOC family protein [Phenylobacterium sp.]|uniref:VOC family protein n=1 Tax=Phenylobacterium sp. TaxID=1871053 RepID=UPI0011FA025A|nr:VOC family protein [Phenylobacterium sp.]THD63541.1 MAG: VOC family protein [Phenylobacterium sp.]